MSHDVANGSFLYNPGGSSSLELELLDSMSYSASSGANFVCTLAVIDCCLEGFLTGMPLGSPSLPFLLLDDVSSSCFLSV